MKQIIYILLALLLAAPLKPMAQEPTVKANPDYRNAFWVHGLQGDVNSLKAMSDYFAARYRINSYHLSYTSNRGIIYAADQLNGFGFEEQEDDIVIAHSMGGLVSRQHQKQASTSKQFGGLITLCTPHKGAEFANSFDNGKLETFYEKTVTDGLVGYVNIGHMATASKYHRNVISALNNIGSTMEDSYNSSSFAGDLFLTVLKINGLLNFIGLDYISDNFVSILKGYTQQFVALAAEVVCGDEEDYRPWSKNDLKPNSPVITNLNNTTLACPKIAVSCVEDYPTGIRFLGSRISYMKQNSPGIGQITDNDLLNLTTGIGKDSRICANRYYDLYCSGSWWSLGLTNSHYKAKRDAFNRQAAFWENGFEREFQKCLGSIYYTTETIWISEWVWAPGNDGTVGIIPSFPIIELPPHPGEDPGNTDGWVLITSSHTVQIEHIHPNDGIVTLPSQEGLAGAETVTIPQTNHEQARSE
ncbi:MAG: hypothetical protein PHE03_12050, partial [Bacteroidales bacterium]|nr:hypothetical protein [Bacteroidales bacterium]